MTVEKQKIAPALLQGGGLLLSMGPLWPSWWPLLRSLSWVGSWPPARSGVLLGPLRGPGREICGTGSSSASSKGVSGGFPWQAVHVRTGTLLVKIVRAAPWLQVLGAP